MREGLGEGDQVDLIEYPPSLTLPATGEGIIGLLRSARNDDFTSFESPVTLCLFKFPMQMGALFHAHKRHFAFIAHAISKLILAHESLINQATTIAYSTKIEPKKTFSTT